MPDDLKPVLARQMEVYAGFLEHTDFHAGRLHRCPGRARHPRRHADLLHHRRQRCIGRRHAATEHSTSCSSSMARASSRRPSSWHPRSTCSGRPQAYNHYAVGWAHAMDTPYQWTKQVPSTGAGHATARSCVAEQDRGERRDPQPVPPRHRRRADRPRGGRAAGADLRQRHPAGAARGRLDGVLVR